MSLYRKREEVKIKYKNSNAKRLEFKKHEIKQSEWDACRLFFNYRCAYCGISYEDHFKKERQDLHKEHVVMDGKNDLSNCVPSCKSCNSSKGEKSLNNWYNENNPIYSRDRYLRIFMWLKSEYRKYIKPKKKKEKSK